MKVSLKQRPSVKTNKVTLYLEFYEGYEPLANGKMKIKRNFEKLEYFLYSNPKTPAEKQHNKENQRGAETVLAMRQLEIQNGRYGFSNPHLLNANFIDYFQKLTDSRKKSKANYDNWNSTLKHLINYKGGMVNFKEVNADFCQGFKDYLLNYKNSQNNLLSKNTCSSYFNKFKAAIGQAFEEKIINDNPVKRIKGIAAAETTRQYLTVEEVHKLIKTDCKYDYLKNAFLFSCFTGLRWSDINSLTGNQIQNFEEGSRIHFTQKKTGGVEYLDIPKVAMIYLGDYDADDEKVFKGLKYSAYMNAELVRWIVKAGITKPITFHSARHTYATILINNSVDIYTVSKLLGHSDLKTTQIYTKIIDKTKKLAVDGLDTLFS